MFYVGQEVVCVDDSPDAGPVDFRPGHDASMLSGNYHGLTKDTVYIVRWCGIFDQHRHYLPYYGIRVQGITRGGCWDTPFDARRFRPLHRKSTETGMAILRGILNGQPIKETEKSDAQP